MASSDIDSRRPYQHRPSASAGRNRGRHAAAVLAGGVVSALIGAVMLEPPSWPLRSQPIPPPAASLSIPAFAASPEKLVKALEDARPDAVSAETLTAVSLRPEPEEPDSIADRKAVFVAGVLPLIIAVNEEILADRRRLWRVHYESLTAERLDAADRLWLTVQAERYGVAPDATMDLLARMDMIPPSLALAQAAEESGWGSSRFLTAGNALFGQWVFADGNLVPLDRDPGKTHSVRAFQTLLESVRSYALNLNTHDAYKSFRKVRTQLRNQGKPLAGAVLARELHRYSERGPAYIQSIRSIIAANGLAWLDDPIYWPSFVRAAGAS